MSAFTKLDAGILHSTIWVQPHDVLRAWIALLALADQNGIARTAAPALAHTCMIPLDRMREILTSLESPDVDSRSDSEEGRRIVKIEGGWRLVNYAAYRARRDPDSDRARKRGWDRENRPSGHARAKRSDDGPSQSDESPTSPTQAEADAEADTRDHTPARARELAAVLSQGGFKTPASDSRLIEAAAVGVRPESLAEVIEAYAGRAHWSDSPSYVLAIAIDGACRARTAEPIT